MVDKLEAFVNWLNDMDWAWWPLLSLRPPKDKDIDNLLLLKLALFYGSIIGALFLAVVIIGAIEALTWGEVLVAILFCLLFGWTFAFIFYKISIAYAWNRRARRLRHGQEYDMWVEIYKLHREALDWVIDEKQLVAVVTVKDGQGDFQIYDKSYEKFLRKLFSGPATAHKGGGTTLNSACLDAFVTYPAWTREAIELIVSDILRGQTLGGKIIATNRA